MTPDLDALAALLAAATPVPLTLKTMGDGSWYRYLASNHKLLDAAVNALPALIEAARREAVGSAGLRDALAHAFEWVRDPEDVQRTVIPTGYTTLLSSEVPAIRRKQADLVVDFLEQSGVARALLHDSAGAGMGADE